MHWRYRDTVLALTTGAFFVTMFGRLAISPVVPAITAEFGVSNASIGAALTGMWLAYGLVQFPSGVLADRYGERAVVLVAVGGTTVASVFLAAAPVYAAFVVCTVFLGAVAGLHFSVATTLLSRIYDSVGTAIGVHNSGATVAGLAGPVAVTWVATRQGWRPALALVALVGVPAFALYVRFVAPTEPRQPERPMGSRFRLAPIAELLTRPGVAFTLAVATVGEFVWQGTASFLPTFLVEYRHRTVPFAAAVFSAYFLAQAVAQIGVGATADRVGRDPAIVGCMLAGAAGIGLLVTAPGVHALGAGVLLLGVGTSFGPAVLPRFFEELSDAERNAGFGLVRTTYMILASLGSVVVGLFADRFGWAVSFGVLLSLFALVAVAVGVVWTFDVDL